MRRAPATLLLVAVALAALAGCGSGGSSGSVSEIAERQVEAAKETAEATRAAEARAPKGASPAQRALYAAFPPPQTAAMEPATAKAVKAGEAACKGKTPVEVKEQFLPAAEEFLEPEQEKMIGRIGRYEKQERTDRSFVAGQLAADTYAATLPEEELEQYGYQGCIYALALGLERKLSATISRSRGK